MFSRREFIGALIGGPMSIAGGDRAFSASVMAQVASEAENSIAYGTCVVLDQLQQNEKLRRVISDRHTSVTPEWSLMWSSFEPTPGNFQYPTMDGIIQFAKRLGMSIQGHALLWEQGTPGWGTPRWVIQRLSVPKPNWNLVDTRIRSLVSRYRDDIRLWNVVNEPIETGSRADGLRTNIFLRAFGPTYIDRALLAAREAAPAGKLMINEYSLEYRNPVDNARRNASLRLVERLLRRGIPLDAFGIQGHLDLAKGSIAAPELRNFMKELASFGLDIHVTELDVKEADLSVTTLRRDRQVASEVSRFLAVALDQPAVKSVTTWGVSDAYSWLKPKSNSNGVYSNGLTPLVNRGLPYDVDMKPKLMAAALNDALVDRTTTTSLDTGNR